MSTALGSARWHRGRRTVRLLVALLFATLLAVGSAVSAPTRAMAATGDRIDTFDASYSVLPSGVVRVRETITYRFGAGSGRHGIERSLVTREPYDDSQDQVYGIDNLTVTSPSGAAADVARSNTSAKKGREQQLRLRIGDPNTRVSTPTATYFLSYDVTGALRTSPGYDEFFWDATGLDSSVVTKVVNITASVPGGSTKTSCFYGPPGSRQSCSSRIVGGVGRFTHRELPPGQGVSIGVKIKPGLVADHGPHLVPAATRLSPTAKAGLATAGIGGLISLIAAPLLGVLWWRKNGRDLRYAGFAPGTVPRPGEAAQVTYHDPDLPIPVAFSPPKIPVAEAGLLIDGQVNTRETAATLIDLAVRGAVTVHSSGDEDFAVTLVDAGRATAPHETALLDALFAGQPPGAVVDLAAPGSLQPAHQALQSEVIRQVDARGWFREVPPARAAKGIGVGAVLIAGFVLFQLSPVLLVVLVPLLPVVLTIAVVRRKLRRGQRTPEGRAMCDQVEGFKTYLATAEADQLRFEEGEDIFSRYLPWAIAFDLADRWAKICADLVSMGRLPADPPYWYYGTFNMYAFNTGFLTSTLTSAASPAPSAGSGGTGFGGGSSFGGGGFSGGGGGGGGTGSW